MSTTGLKRVLGLPEITFIAIGGTIGGGIFVFTGIVFKITGQALPIAYSLAVIPVFISMLPLAMLGSAIPTVGGNYRYPSRMVSPGLAFVGVWVYALASFFGQIPLYAIGCAKYAQAVFPGISLTVFALVLVTVFLIINVLGVKLAAQIQGILVLILISALLYYAFSGFKELNAPNFSNIMEKGSANLLLGVALLTFTYFGSNAIIELGGEIVNPGKVIPRAFFIAFPVITFIYILVAVATVGAVPLENLKTFTEPLIRVSEIICSKGGVLFFISGGAILALTTTLNALFLYGTKSLMMIVSDRIFPEKIGKVNKRFGTPHILLFFIWVFSVIGIISGFSLQTLASYAALGGLIIFFPVMLASMKFPSLYPEHYNKSGFKLKGIWRWFCPGVGILMVLFFSLVLIADLKSLLKIGCFILFVISGIVYYWLRKRYLKTLGIDLNDLMKKESWNE
ncbi:MAG: APC family permease [Desulfobacterales bacterium]|nr:APC family permease [Desulfobacterales bacterium]